MKYVILVFIALFLFFVSCGGASVELSSPRTVKLALIENENHPLTKSLEEFSRIMSERTNNTLQVQVYPSRRLGEERHVIDKLTRGEIDMACVNSLSLSSYSKAFNAFGFPFIFTDEAHLGRVIEGDTGTGLLASLDKNGITGIGFFDPGALYFYSSRDAVLTPADFKNAKVRVPQNSFLRQFVDKLGGFAAPMQEDQIYYALKTKVIDVVADTLVHYVDAKHYEVAKSFTWLPHTRIPFVLIMNKKTFAGFSKEVQDVIKSASRDSAAFCRNEMNKYEDQARSVFSKNGVVVSRVSDIKEFRQSAQALMADQSAETKQTLERIQ